MVVNNLVNLPESTQNFSMGEMPSTRPVDSYLYRDQVHTLTNWFNSWSECEQTVTLYSLIKRLNFTQTKFLLVVLEQNLSLNQSQLSILESQANDAGHLQSICMTENSSIFQILSLLPLLRPNNAEAASTFVSLIPVCLSWCLEQDLNLEECRQLISYALIHPGLTNDQRGSLSHWLVSLDQRDTNAAPPISQFKFVYSGLSVGNESWNTANTCDGSSNQSRESRHHLPLTATLSAPPTVPTIAHSASHSQYGMLEKKHSTGNRYIYSATPPTPLSTSPDYDSSYGGSTGSLVETVLDACTSPVDDRSGMRDVPGWLKSLRLHKYASLFNNFTYEEMLALDDAKLTQIKVTKGARHKIVLSINKLNERPSALRQMEKDVIECGGNIKQILSDLKHILVTPIKSYITISSTDSHVSLDDLPTLVCNVLAKLCSQILLHPDEDNCAIFLQMLDRCNSHEAFSTAQKQKVLQWKAQCQRLSAISENKWNNRGSVSGSRRGSNASVGGCSVSSSHQYNSRPVVSATSNSVGIIGTPPQRSASGTNLNYMGSSTGLQVSHPSPRLMPYQQQPSATIQYHTASVGNHTTVHRTQSSSYPTAGISSSSIGTQSPLSYYPRRDANGYSSQCDSISTAESMSRLESLCRSVADHALSNDFGAAEFGVSQ